VSIRFLVLALGESPLEGGAERLSRHAGLVARAARLEVDDPHVGDPFAVAPVVGLRFGERT
jgi:hypothetical protein